MKILIVSGFLGAGKTSFIQALSKKAGIDFAVMENEYGAGIDGNILTQDRLKVWEMTEGCICCSLKSDFASSILTIANTVNPEYLVVEPTGVGLLSAVLTNISKIEYDRIRLLEPVVIADATCVEEYLKIFPEIYSDQITAAQRIILSKTENKTPEECARLRLALGRINPVAEIISTPYAKLPEDWWNALLKRFYMQAQSGAAVENIEPPDLETVALMGIHVDSVEELMGMLVAVLHKQFGAIYRAKGYLPINGQWARFDIVNTNYTIETCRPMQEAKAVFIGRALDRERLQELFAESQ